MNLYILVNVVHSFTVNIKIINTSKYTSFLARAKDLNLHPALLPLSTMADCTL